MRCWSNSNTQLECSSLEKRVEPFILKFFSVPHNVRFNIYAGLFVRTNYNSLDPTIMPVILLSGNESECIPVDTFYLKLIDLHLKGQ